jgi:hypothetical protein
MEFKEIISLIAKLGHFILLLNTFFYFKSYRKNTIAFKIITFYLLYVLIIQLRMSYLRSYKITNLHYTHFYFIGQLILLSLFYLKIFKNKVLTSVIKGYLTVALIALTIYYSIFPETFYEHNTFEVIVASTPLIVYSFIFFIKKIDNPNKSFIYLNSGLFLYLLCSVLLFSVGNLKSSIKLVVWLTNASLYLVYQILIFVEWYKNFRKKAATDDSNLLNNT